MLLSIVIFFLFILMFYFLENNYDKLTLCFIIITNLLVEKSSNGCSHEKKKVLLRLSHRFRLPFTPQVLLFHNDNDATETVTIISKQFLVLNIHNEQFLVLNIHNGTPPPAEDRRFQISS